MRRGCQMSRKFIARALVHRTEKDGALAETDDAFAGAARRRPDATRCRGRFLRGIAVGLCVLMMSGAVPPPVQGAVPSAPTGVHIPFVTRYEIAVAWTPPATATLYKLEYRAADAPGSPYLSYGPGATFDETSMRIGELKEDTSYDVRVFAGNADGWSAPAELVGDANAKTTNPPDPPLDVIEYAFTETSVTLTWTDAPGGVPTHWRVKVSECQKKIWQVPCIDGRPCLTDRTVRCGEYQHYKEGGIAVEFTGKPAIIRNLRKGYTYFMVVEARNRNINGYDYGGSLPARITPRAAYDSAPTDLRVNGVFRDAVLLSWKAAPGATHYRVQYRVPAESSAWRPPSNQDQLLTTGTEYVVVQLTQDYTYEFRVLARDLFEQTIGGGQVEWAGDVQGYEEDQYASNIVSATPVHELTGVPTGLVVVGVRETEVHFRWNALARAEYYVLQYKKVDEAYETLEYWRDVESSAGEARRISATSGAVTELTTGRAYEFRLKAFNSHVATDTYLGYAGPSAVVFARPLVRLPPSQDFTLISQPWLDMLRCEARPCVLGAASKSWVQLQSDAPAVDGILIGSLVRITSGAAADKTSRISAYNGTSKMAFLAVPFGMEPAAGDTYEVSRYAIGDDRATMTWTHFPGATKYKISIRHSNAHEGYVTEAVLREPMDDSGACTREMGGSRHPSLGLVTTRCYQLSGLAEGVTYDVILSAGNEHLEWGVDSSALQITPMSPPQETPGRPAVLSQTADSVTFKWTSPTRSSTPTVTYRVMSRPVSSQNWSAPLDFSLLTDADEGFQVRGLARGVAYDFKIVAGNLAGYRYPAMRLRLVTPCTRMRVVAVRRVFDCQKRAVSIANCTAQTGTYVSVGLAWDAPPHGYYFKVFARLKGSSEDFVGLPQVALPPFESKAVTLGPNVTTFAFDNNHFPPLRENTEFEYKVLSSFNADGPFEGVGSTVVVSVSATAPAPVHTLRLKSKTLRSITLNWQHEMQYPQPYFYVARLCPAAAANCSGSLYPNNENMSRAERFTEMEAVLDRFRGVPLEPDVAYNVTIYACNYFDANGDGILTGDEGCDAEGVRLPYSVMPGGLSPPVTGLRVTQVFKNILRLEWERPGQMGSAAIMYKIQQREMGASQWMLSKRILVRGTFGTCNPASTPNCPQCDGAMVGDAKKCLRAVGVTYGASQGADTCGVEYCRPDFTGATLIITEGEHKDEQRILIPAEIKNPEFGPHVQKPSNVFITNETLFGNFASDFLNPDFTFSSYSVYKEEQLGGLCCPITSQTVVAYIADLKADTAYQFKVFAGNMNEEGLETRGSPVATAFTISKPNAVKDLSFLYLIGHNSTRVAWTDPGGPRFCGERVYQILARLSQGADWQVLNLTHPHAPWIKHTEYNAGVGRVELTVMGLPWARTSSSGQAYPSAVLNNFFMVRTYCSNVLGLPNSDLANMTYLDDIAYSRVDGNELNVTLKPPPSALVRGLQVLWATQDSVFLRWQLLPRAEMYKVLVSYDMETSAGPWIRGFGAFSAWENWPRNNETQIFRTSEAKVTGLLPGSRYRFKIMGGTRHGNAGGTFSAESLPTTLAYTLVPGPAPPDIELSIRNLSASAIRVRFSVGLQMSVDPSNHSRPLVSLLLKRGLGDFEGGINASGCTNVVVADDAYIGPPPGCSELTVLNYTDQGRSYFEYEFDNLKEGLAHEIMVKTWNLNSPNRHAIVYSGNATSCICAEFVSEDECASYRIFGSTLACDPSSSYAYMQPPASGSDGGYRSLYAFVRQGSGEGQRRRIDAYLGAPRRLTVDTPWEILLDETSVVEIHESGLAAEGRIIAGGCASADVVCDTVNLDPTHTSSAKGAYANHFMEFKGGTCDRQMRRITAYDGENHQLVVYPAFTCNPAPDTMTYEIRPFYYATKSVGPIQQRGPPGRPDLPSTNLITHNAVELTWPDVDRCISSTGIVLKCQVEMYRLRKKKTHDSSDFPVANSTWDTAYVYTVSAATTFSGLEDMCSFEIQVAAKTEFNDVWSTWSLSQYVKLTGGAPSLQPTLLPFLAGQYNDKIQVRWTVDLNPKQIDRFYISFGETANNMRDFTTLIDGKQVRKIFYDSQACTILSATKATCEGYVTGLEMGTIYVIKVYGGNMNGFEEVGTKAGTQATLRLPVSPVTDFKLEGIKLSGNVSDYGVSLSWSRPQGYPSVTKYYIAASQNFKPFAALSPVIESTDRVVLHEVGNLDKGSNYRFRVHCGNADGPTGFHLDMENDPTRSVLVEAIPDGVPGRVEVTSATPIVPDMNTMASVTWNLPNAGASASYYTIGMKLIYTLLGCETCDKETYPSGPFIGFCLTNNAENPIYDEATNTYRYRKCNFNPPCDATCDAVQAVQMYKGCLPTDATCATNPSCDPFQGLCVAPCQGAQNEGPESAGQACIFNSTTAQVTGLARDAWYELYIFAGNTAGLGRASDPIWVKTAALPVPVTGLHISAVARTSVSLVWNVMDPSLCTGGFNGNCTYKVTWDPPTAEGSMAYTSRKIGDDGRVYYENTFEHAVDFSQGAVRYVYRVYAGDDLTNLYEQFGTDITLPGPAVEFKVVAATENSLTFGWIPDVAADTYQVFMSSGLAYRSASAETRDSSTRVEGLAQGLPYSFKVFSKVAGLTPFEYSGSNTYLAVPTGLSSAPQDLAVEFTSESTVKLTWQSGDPQPAVRYKIVRSVNGSPLMAFPQDVEMLQGAAHSALITDLSDSSQYKFKVFAGNFKGFEQVGSNVVEQVQPVGRARELAIRGVSDTSVTVDWLPPRYGRTPSHYQLEYTIGDVATRIADVQHLGGSRATQSALITPLFKTKYRLRVFCKAQSGYYEPSGTGDASAVPLLVPYGLRAVFTTVDSVTLAWQMPPYAGNGFEPLSFKIEYVMTSDGTTGKVAAISVYQNVTTITGLQTNRPYTFAIMGEFETGLYLGTLGSNAVEATPLDQPCNLTFTAVTATTVSLEWSAPAVGILPMGYRVRVTDMQTGVFNDADGVPHRGSFKTTQAYTVTGLTNGRQYGFVVVAQAGTGAYSENDISPITTTPLAVPEDLTVLTVTDTSAQVAWQPPLAVAGAVNPVSYELHYDDKIQIIPFGSTEWQVHQLAGGSEYQFCLFIRSPAGDLIPGVNSCTNAVALNQVLNLRATDSTNTSITVEWDPLQPIHQSVSYLVVASPIMREISALTGQESFVRITDRPPFSATVVHSGPVPHTATFANVSFGDIFSIQVFVSKGSYTEPVGSNVLQLSPVGRATRTRLCYYDKTEVSIQWAAPASGPTPSSYRISYRLDSCSEFDWQQCATSKSTGAISHRGQAGSSQSYALVGLSEGGIYDVRVHALNDVTMLFDPVGSLPLLVRPRGDRSDFALHLPLGGKGFVEVNKASDQNARVHFESNSVTLEAWVRLDAAAAQTVGYQGVAGNLYSYSVQSEGSRGAGHFGYGLVCQTKEDARTYCGMVIGTRVDETTSLNGLCTSLNFENPSFCGGTPGWTKANRAESLVPIEPGVWTHLAGSFNHTNGHYIFLVNGETHVNRVLTYSAVGGETVFPKVYYSGNDGAYPGQVTMPRHRMDWNIGRLLLGEMAPTVATAAHAYFTGVIDDVRVWSYGKTAVEMLDTAYLDTVSPSAEGLLGYWPFDGPSFEHKCADEMRVARDARETTGIQLDARLLAAALIVESSVPMDRAPRFSSGTPANNSHLTVMLGDTIYVGAEADDANPTDDAFVVLEVPASRYSHPTGATFSDVSPLGAHFTWSPLPRDAGKNVSLCFTLSNDVTNPLRPDFALAQDKLQRCVMISVPLCMYKARQGDTVRSIAYQFKTNWRTLFMLNPEIGHPNDVAAGLTMRIGSVYKIRPQDDLRQLASSARVSWSSLANNNAAIMNRLWTDDYFKAALTFAGRSAVIDALNTGQSVFDTIHDDMSMLHNYTGAELCLVSQLHSNCI